MKVTSVPMVHKGLMQHVKDACVIVHMVIEGSIIGCLTIYIALKLLYTKQFIFQQDHSTNHVILQLMDQIHEVFKDNKYTLDVLNELSKAFDTVDHNILLLKNRNERKSW